MPPLLIALLLSLSLALPPAAHALEFEGQTFADTVEIARTPLRLNGVGLRAVFVLKGYAAGLYLPEQATSLKDAMAQPGPKRLQMRMMVRAGPQEFSKALVAGVRKNASEAELALLEERIQRFDQIIRGLPYTKKGDVVDLDYVPDIGMTLSFNGQIRGAPVPGPDFYEAVLGIFIGEHPIDRRMKKGLLGQ